MRRDSFYVDHGFISRYLQIQVLLMDTSEATGIHPKRRARSCTTITVDCTAAITSVIPGPFAGTVTHGHVSGVAAMIALPLERFSLFSRVAKQVEIALLRSQ